MIRDPADDPKDGDRSTLAQRVRYTALIGEQPTAADGWVIENLPGARTNCRAELEIIWMSDDLEMQIVIDRSGSMAGTPFANAQTAATTLVDEVEDGATALGVASFATSPNQDQPVVAIPAPPGTVKTDIKAVINALTTGGNTAMFDAADLALDNLQTYASTNMTNAAQIVFLLSDGMDNASTETQASITTAYQNADVPLVTFAYGSFAPDGVLRELADDTGGLFRASPTDLAEIQSAFLSAKAALTSSAALIQDDAVVPAGNTSTFSFAVDSSLEELSIFANYLGGDGDVDFSVLGPSMSDAGVTFACTEVPPSTSCSALVGQGTILSEGTGVWSVTATNNTGSPVTVNVDILATPLPVRTYDLVVGSQSGSEVSFPEPIVLTASVSQGLPITGVNISATITDPASTTTSLTLVDTGTDGDGIAGDGTYSAIVDYTMNGLHTVEVMVDNSSLNASFTTAGFQPTHLPTSAQGGGTPDAPALPPITEDFIRTAGLQLVVSGVLADDHPDAAPGTAVAANNGDVPGKINYSGDPDVFTVPTAGFNYLTFRVTGLALGMDPRLRILAQDGSTELASLTLADIVAGTSYVAVVLPTAGNAVMHAEVTHRGAGTGTYLFSAGTQLLSDPPLILSADVKPGSCPNIFNVQGRGVLNVALLGTELFDAFETNVESVRLARADGVGGEVAPNEGPSGPRSRFKDVGTPSGLAPCDCHDLEGDGLRDLAMKFRTDELAPTLQLDSLPRGSVVELALKGMLLEGIRFQASDCVRVQ